MKRLLIVLLVMAMLFSVTACGNSEPEEKSASADGDGHIYSAAEVVDSLSGGGQKIGEVSIVKIDSASVTDEALEDWYFNYVLKNDYDYCLIVYTDQQNIGVYAKHGWVEKDVPLEPEQDGAYTLAGEGILYTVTDDHLVPDEDASFAVADAVAEELEALFPEEYREDYTFGVQVDPHRDGGLIVSLNVDQESDDTGTAFAMALEYYEKAVDVAQQHGETVVDYSIMVDNKGAPVRWYRTSDGVTYTDTISGEQLEAPAP